MATKLHLTRHNLSARCRGKLVDLLNSKLATLLDLHSQCHQAHWNVRGRSFYSLHKLFEDVADLIEPHLDVTAERITALGGDARGTIRMAAENSILSDYPARLNNDIEHVAALLDRFALATRVVRGAIDEATELGDAGTADLLTAVSRDLDKGLWLLEAHRP